MVSVKIYYFNDLFNLCLILFFNICCRSIYFFEIGTFKKYYQQLIRIKSIYFKFSIYNVYMFDSRQNKIDLYSSLNDAKIFCEFNVSKNWNWT